jgi:hypothetical protein
LDLTDDLDYYKFTEHCEFVYDVLGHETAKNADTLYRASKFWTVKWQVENRQRQYEKLFCYLETIFSDEAERQLYAMGVEKTKEIRKHFFERFGSGQPIVLQDRVRKYLLCMPNAQGVAFPHKCNMPDKLDQLEEERNYLLRMCPKDKHKDYEDGKETTLLRNIINHLPPEYDDAVQNVRNIMKIRDMVKSGNVDSITNIDDAIKINYDTTWLPPYAELRVGLVNAWTKFQRRWEEQSGSKNKVGHPTMMVGDGEGMEKTCYGCGRKGHLRGSPECKAGKDSVWGGAPKAYLDKIERKFGKTPNNGKRPLPDDSKQVCKFHAEGYCKWADRCNFLHEGQQGGSKRPRDYKGSGKGLGKGKDKGKSKGKGKGRGGRSRNQKGSSTLVVKKKVNLEDKDAGSSSTMMVGSEADHGQEDEGSNEIEKDLYNLMRGYTSLMIAGSGRDDSDEESVDEDPDDQPNEVGKEVEKDIIIQSKDWLNVREEIKRWMEENHHLQNLRRIIFLQKEIHADQQDLSTNPKSQRTIGDGEMKIRI